MERKPLSSILSILAVGALAAALSACVMAPADDDDSTLLVVNASDYRVDEIYLTYYDSSSWGPNLLRSPLYPDEDVLLVDIECDYYDALLVDEDGVECELRDVDLCFSDATWYLRNNTCDIFAAKGDADTVTLE